MAALQELQIELAGICNIACSYCTWRERPTGKKLMDRGLARCLIIEASVLDPLPLVTFHGVGEPTLHPDLCTIMKYAEDCGITQRLSTNCVKLDQGMIESLRNLKRLGLSLALHQGLPEKTRGQCEDNAMRFLLSEPECRSVEVLLVCDGTGAPQAERLVEKFLPVIEKIPSARINLKQPQTWPRSEPIKGHIPGGAWENHPQVFVDRVPTPRSLGRDCRMPEYLLNIQADGTTTLCCVGEEDWHLPNIEQTSIRRLWDSPEAERVRQTWRAAGDELPCGHCKKRTDC